MLIDFSTLDSYEQDKLLGNTVIPRPIAFILTEDEGSVNVAGFSLITPIYTVPKSLLISFDTQASEHKKTSLEHIIKHKKATVCLTHDLERIKGKTLTKIHETHPPIIEDVEMAYFCSLYNSFELLDGENVPVFLEVKHFFAQDDVLDEHYRVKSLEEKRHSNLI